MSEAAPAMPRNDVVSIGQLSLPARLAEKAVPWLGGCGMFLSIWFIAVRPILDNNQVNQAATQKVADSLQKTADSLNATAATLLIVTDRMNRVHTSDERSKSKE